MYLTWAFNLADNYWKRKAETGEDRIEDIELAYKIGGDVAKGIAIRNADDPEMLHVANIICLEHTSVMNEEKRLDLENRKIEISEEFQGMFQNLTYRIDFLRDNVLIQCLFHVRDKYKK